MNINKIFKIIFPALLISMSGLVAPDVSAQQTRQKDKTPELNCTECHTCDVPTTRVPCLKSCPRGVMVHQTSEHQLGEAPDKIVLDDLVDIYKSVHFDHKLHAQMAEMGGDCATCHHYSPPGHIPPCRECHSPDLESTDLQKPNLKGAYHRQCLACHAEWSHETKCVVCHVPNNSGDVPEGTEDPTDIMGKSHPVITVPMKRVYQTDEKAGPIVTFQHKEHIDLFGFRCVDCHRKENCSNCHDLQQTNKTPKTQEEIHAICNDCHISDKCTKCHDTKERPGFSHNKTGWPLNPYHQKLDCWACHPTGKRISKISPMCENCHQAWNKENFLHAVTGLKLDEMHADLDCEDCHAGKKFSEDPKCDDCHDDGRTAQSAPPGMKVRHPGN